MRDLFERFQVLQAGVRSLSHIVQNEGDEPSIDQLDEFAQAVDHHLVELSSLKSEVLEHYFQA